MKPSTPKGTRDFSPKEMVRRNYIFDTIKRVYQTYGYLPIETPAMENIETLTGKYGDEGDKLIFKILPRGEKLSSAVERLKVDPSSAAHLAEEALRYDLTVPFARFVVQHQNDIIFPFKRYQIQPVWRAERPQKGRFREFYQCDADVVGSDSLINEVELIQMIDDVFSKLGLSVTIKINNRKILSGIAEIIGQPEKLIDITVAIDKLDKIGIDKVIEELVQKGITQSAIDKLLPVIEMTGSANEKLAVLKKTLADSETGMAGIKEMEQIYEYVLQNFDRDKTYVNPLKVSRLDFDLTLARGLNYYTGAIIEVKANEGSLSSSICGGGRYDNLTGMFGLPGISGVGISFGADRIYEVMNELNIFPTSLAATTQILFVNFGKYEEKFCLPILGNLRSKGISAEIYPEAAKIKKQMAYADNKQIPFVAIIGSDEIKEEKVTLKDMITGEQKTIWLDDLIDEIL